MNDDRITLPSGTVINPNCGVIGIDGEFGEIYGGYDAPLLWKEAENLPDEDRKFLATMMVERWKKWGKL